MSPFQIANRICIVSLGTHYSSKENCQITNQMSNQISSNIYMTPINFFVLGSEQQRIVKYNLYLFINIIVKYNLFMIYKNN